MPFLLRRIVRALPERQAEWGEAMEAELAGIAGPVERSRFVLGCAAVVARRPAGIVTIGRLLVGGAALTAAIMLAWAIDVPRIRVEAIATVGVLLGAFGLLRSRIGFGRASGATTMRLVAAGGAIIAAAQVLLTFHQLHADAPLTLPPNATIGVYDTGRATGNLVALVVVLGVFLIALARMTARGSAVNSSAVVTGAATAGRASMVWLVVVLLRPSVATIALPSLITVLFAGVVAAGLTARSRRPGVGPASAVVAGLVASAGTGFAVGTLMDLLALSGSWVSNSAPPSQASPAPTRIVDTVVVYLPGLVLTLLLTLVLRTKRQADELPAQPPGMDLLQSP